MKAIWSLILVGYLVSINACQKQQLAVGDETEVFVVADSLLFKAIAPELKSALERTLLTPQPEKVFTIKYSEPGSLGNAAIRHYIIMAGTLDGKDQTSQQVRGMLNETLLKQVQAEKSFVFRKQNPWAKNQLLLVLVAKDQQTLKQQISENEDYLFEIMQKDSFDKTAAEMFAQLEQKKLEDKLLQKYGWTLRIQHDYIVYREDEKNNFVMLRRTSPERWLFVYWVDNARPDMITREWVFTTRNKIGHKYYENDTVVDSLWQVHETRLDGRWVLEVQGLWENKEKVGGGPFKSFAFYDEPSKRAYLIDIAVFAPGMRKEPFLRQLEVMARSFKTAADMKMTENRSQ